MISGPSDPVRYDQQGLVVAVAQDSATGSVLMVAYMNAEALRLTQETGEAHFWSRSRQRLWRKGESSGAVLRVDRVQADCDGDALLLAVRPLGPACHLGRRSCFPDPAIVLDELDSVLRQRQASAPSKSYTARLLAAGPSGVSRKVGEEAVEVILAAHQPDPESLVAEVADLWYHSAVLLLSRGLGLGAVLEELRARRGNGGKPDAAE